MTSGRLSASVGFILLIGCMVGIGVVIFGFGPSLTQEPEESFTEWQGKEYAERKLEVHRDKSTPTKSELDLAEELERLFSKGVPAPVIRPKNKTNHVGIEAIKFANVDPTKIIPKLESTRGKISVEKLSPSPNVRSGTQPPTDGFHDSDTLTTISTSRNPPKLQLRGLVVPTASLAPMLPAGQQSTSQSVVQEFPANEKEDNNESSEEILEWQDAEIEDNENIFEDDLPYPSFLGGFENGGGIQELGEIFSLASNLYTSGGNSSAIQSFLQIINQTLVQGNNSNLLTHLNELYSRPGILPSLSSAGDVFVGRNSYETSLTAFVFMSFGVFLLNQIHGLISKESGHGREDSQSRQFDMNHLEESSLAALFEPPQNNSTKEDDVNSFLGRSTAEGYDSLTPSLTPDYVNNMFRGFLNLVNAYTKNSQALECIWSLYCEDLDKTSAKDGMYGLAARINSIGLRLIMHQIPTELTLDVMLRSMLGWDGLPCKKMFSSCDASKAAEALKAAGASNNHTI